MTSASGETDLANRQALSPGGAGTDSPEPLAAAITRWLKRWLWHPLRDGVADAYQKQDYPLGYSRALDGLRGLMTIGIVTSHVQYSTIPGALVFMDFFYVASGFYITGLLLRDLRTYGRVQFDKFYIRRVYRILPPLVAMLSGFLIFGYFFSSDFHALLVDAAIGFFYVANWWRAFHWPGIAYMGHTWSLGVEEQFYLLWPITLLMLFRCFGIGWRMIASVMALALAIALWRIWLTWIGTPPYRLYNGFDTRADALMIGCALAITLKVVPLDNRPSFDWALRGLAWPIGLFAIYFYFFVDLDWHERFYYYAGISIGSALAVALIVVLIRPLGTVLHRCLELRPFVFLGRIFYAVYLWHFPILLGMEREGWPMWSRVVVLYPLTLFIATLSYAFIERHFMRTKTSQAAPAVGPIPDAVPLSAR